MITRRFSATEMCCAPKRRTQTTESMGRKHTHTTHPRNYSPSEIVRLQELEPAEDSVCFVVSNIHPRCEGSSPMEPRFVHCLSFFVSLSPKVGRNAKVNCSRDAWAARSRDSHAVQTLSHTVRNIEGKNGHNKKVRILEIKTNIFRM